MLLPELHLLAELGNDFTSEWRRARGAFLDAVGGVSDCTLVQRFCCQSPGR
jgi:hypothetical protein